MKISEIGTVMASCDGSGSIPRRRGRGRGAYFLGLVVLLSATLSLGAGAAWAQGLTSQNNNCSYPYTNCVPTTMGSGGVPGDGGQIGTTQLSTSIPHSASLLAYTGTDALRLALVALVAIVVGLGIYQLGRLRRARVG